jgi:hypothetical protein
MKIERSYKNKEGKEIELKVPKIKIGNNLAEDETVEIQILYPIIKDDKGKYKNYTVKCMYNGEQVYAQLTQITTHTLEKYDYVNQAFKITRTIKDGKTRMIVTPVDPTLKQIGQTTIPQTVSSPLEAETSEGKDLLANTVILDFTTDEQDIMNKLMGFKGQPAFSKRSILVTLKKHLPKCDDARANMIANHLLTK